jgi:hypothetical protein
MEIKRVSDYPLPEGLFYGVAILSDGEKVLYEIKEADNGAAALEALREHASSDESLGKLADGQSPVVDVQIVI